MRNLALTLLAAIGCIASPAATLAAPPAGADIACKVDKDGTSYTVAAELTVAATVDEVWAVLTDFEHMAQILSNVDDSQVANRDGNKFEVVQKSHASAGLMKVSLNSVRQVELVPKSEIRSHLVKGDLKSSDFTTKVAADGAGTRVTVRGKFVAGGMSASWITPETVESQTRRQYQELREEVLRRKTNTPPPACLLAKNCSQGPG